MKYISLYSGAGGFDLGLMRAGFTPAIATDEHQASASTCRAALPEGTTVICADIHDLLNAEVFSGFGKRGDLTLVAGRPPLLGLSPAEGDVDPESDSPQLLFRFMDAVEQAKPAAFIMTTTPVLASRRWAQVLGALRSRARAAGYRCSAPVLDAADYGVAQRRELMFLIGLPAGAKPAPEAGPQRPRVSAGAAIAAAAAVTTLRDIPCTSAVYPHPHPKVTGSPYSGQLVTGWGRMLDLRRVAPSLSIELGANKTPVIDVMQLESGATPWIEGYHRMLVEGHLPLAQWPPGAVMRRCSLRECAALAGFPADHPFSGADLPQFKMVGQSVPPPLAEAVGRAVLAGLS
jgi:DNA (cytosine-5)-methyltransferase 1